MPETTIYTPRTLNMLHGATMHYDAGHGWLEVSRRVLDASGAAPFISCYSYESRGRVFLEEDCDAPKFLRAVGLDDVTPLPACVQAKHHRGDAPIRRMASYRYVRHNVPLVRELPEDVDPAAFYGPSDADPGL